MPESWSVFSSSSSWANKSSDLPLCIISSTFLQRTAKAVSSGTSSHPSMFPAMGHLQPLWATSTTITLASASCPPYPGPATNGQC